MQNQLSDYILKQYVCALILSKDLMICIVLKRDHDQLKQIISRAFYPADESYNPTFLTASSAQRSLKKLCCCCSSSSCWRGNMSTNSTKKLDIYWTVNRAVCPRNQWNSKLVYKISGIQSLSTKFVEINAVCRRNQWNSVFPRNWWY